MIIINQQVYEDAVERGKSSSSGYERAKAGFLEELKGKGILRPKPYVVPDGQREKLGRLIDFFFRTQPDEVRRLAAQAFSAFIRHEKATLERLLSPEDPRWADMSSQLPRLESIRNALASGASIDQIPNLRTIIGRYFEDALYSPIIAREHFNPVFQWEGYAPFEEFLLRFRKNPAARKEDIRRGSDLKVFQAISDVILPFRAIKTAQEMGALVDKWEAFRGVREYIAKTNCKLWEEIGNLGGEDVQETAEFKRDFESMLEFRTANINRTIQEIDHHIEKEKAMFTSRITRWIIAALGAVAPAGLSLLLDDLYSQAIEGEVREAYPGYRALLEYERIVDSVLHPGELHQAHAVVSGEYEPVIYWDKR